MIWEPYRPGSLGGLMQCPICRQHTPDSWQSLFQRMSVGLRDSFPVEPPGGLIGSHVSLDLMYCANPECRQLVVRVHENSDIPPHAVANPEMLTRTWIARPRAASRPIDPLVLEPIRTQYIEAAAILETSPSMSAVLSRRVLADLLSTYAGKTQYKLSDRIDAFNKETQHPSGIRENLHHLREIADFGAHTQKDDQAEIIDISREEAEWTLDILDRLFDYFIVAPEKDRRMRESFDKKLMVQGIVIA